MTADLQQTRYDRLLRRVGGIIGPGSKVAEALSELFPTLDVESVPSELLFLSGTRTGTAGTTIAATAAEISKIQLFNPADSGHLVTVTDIWASSVANMTLEFDFRSTALDDNVGNNVLRDQRAGVSSLAVAQLRSESSAGGVSPFWVIRVLGRTPLHIESRNDVAVLSPGTGIVVAPGVVNQEISASFFWRERVAEASELNF